MPAKGGEAMQEGATVEEAEHAAKTAYTEWVAASRLTKFGANRIYLDWDELPKDEQQVWYRVPATVLREMRMSFFRSTGRG
jgi:hypothetical protein